MASGSYGDNLKVTVPNEFDLVFHIRFPENKLIIVREDPELAGNVHLDFTKVLAKIHREKQHATTYTYLCKWLDDDNCLIVNKLQSYIQSCFTKALEDMDWHFDNIKLRYHREGPAHTIKVNGLTMEYSVDFVPGILMDQEQSVTKANVGQWEAIPKPIKWADWDHTSFRSSFYRQEQNLIKDCNNLKNCLRMIKKFRDAHSNMSCMKSYFIKTLFLWKVQEKQNKSYWNNSLSVIILDMFIAMENSLRSEELPFFWDRRLNMYQELSSFNLSEMLRCVRNARIFLEKAKMEITPLTQSLVYEIFLNYHERHPEMKPESNYGGNDMDSNLDEPVAESSCVIL
ncbi:cyclic GMP-AMP synthase-like receptor [Musca vetustissima]|uniref:cyclic GMP-AMP synthase-like receptor n=1 Tax=Musca vetustissima TaxID=27455 RepID=UPI002AB6C3CE|nr:cyclic GMP-AMP synthase-like receptor [Musca vetustissima]